MGESPSTTERPLHNASGLKRLATSLSFMLLTGCAQYPLDGGTGFADMQTIGMGIPFGGYGIGGYGYGTGGNWGHGPSPVSVADSLDGDPHGSGNTRSSAFTGNLNQDSERYYYHPAAGDRGSAYGLIYSP